MKPAVAVWCATLLLGCGGHASKPGGGGPAGGAGAGGGDTAGTGGAITGGGGAGQGALGGGGQAPDDHVPDTVVPYDDEYLDDGSFEELPGFGWDTCFTKTPGTVRSRELGASNGDRFIEIASSTCDSTCSSSHTSDAQLYVWFGEGKAPPPAAGLYVDFVNIDAAAPDGRFTAYAVDLACDTLRPLVDVPLAELSLTADWSTRCFDVELEPSEGLGFAAQGPAFHVGVDALRLGPSCK